MRQRAKNLKSGLLKVPAGLEPQSGLLKVPGSLEREVCHLESVRQLRAGSLALRKCHTVSSQKSGIKKVSIGLELEVWH